MFLQPAVGVSGGVGVSGPAVTALQLLQCGTAAPPSATPPHWPCRLEQQLWLLLLLHLLGLGEVVRALPHLGPDPLQHTRQE